MEIASLIKTVASKMSNDEWETYKQWCKENPGKVMHGSSIRADALNKASYAESIQDLLAMRRCYQIQQKAMSSSTNGFGFYVEAIQRLIDTLNTILSEPKVS